MTTLSDSELKEAISEALHEIGRLPINPGTAKEWAIRLTELCHERNHRRFTQAQAQARAC
jgi:hypothetical protein